MNGATIGILVAGVIVAAAWVGGHHFAPEIAKACSQFSTTVGSAVK